MKRNDFTDGDNLFRFLGSFWTQIFSEPEVLRGETHAIAWQLQQLYSDMTMAISGLGIHTCVPLDTELLTPIILYRSRTGLSQKHVTFGDSTVFGGAAKFDGLRPQYYAAGVTAPAGMSIAGETILNRLFEPSVVLVNGHDYALIDGEIVFAANPFDNPLIPRRMVADANGQPDEMIAMWMTSSRYDRHSIHNAGGCLFFKTPPAVSAAVYSQVIKALFEATAGGPAIRLIDSLVAAASGLPVTVEAVETVQSVGVSSGRPLVITDFGIYHLADGLSLRSGIVAGAALPAGTPLSTATRVEDSVSSPLLWQSLPAVSIETPGFRGGLGFVNASVPVTVSHTSETGEPVVQFQIVGDATVVEDFWKRVEDRSRAENDWLSTRLWTAAGLTDLNGDPDFSLPLKINPLSLLMGEIMPGAILAITIDSSHVVPALLSGLSSLGRLLPAYSMTVVFLNYAAEDSLSFDFESAQHTESFVSLDSQLAVDDSSGLVGTHPSWGNLDSAGTPVEPAAEALSFSNSPDILIDTLALPDSVTELVRAENTPICASKVP